jgi:hypothetical protein
MQAAGAYGMTALYGILPPFMAWRWRAIQAKSADSSEASPSMYGCLVPGGNFMLAFLACCATTVELGRLVLDTEAGPAVLSRAGQTANEALSQLGLAPATTLWLDSLSCLQ